MPDSETSSSPSTSPVRLPSTANGTNLGAFTARDWLLLTVIATMWGSSFLLIDIGLDAFHPTLVSFARLGLGALALACVPRARRATVDRDDVPRVFLLGVLWMGIPLLLFPVAQQWIDSSVAGMINGAMPLATAAWAAVLLRRWPPRHQLLGLVLGFAGIIAIFLPEVPVADTAGSAQRAFGASLVLVAIVLYGLSANLAVPLQHKYGSLALMLRVQLAAMVVIAPFGIYGLFHSTFSVSSALAMVPLGVLCTGAAFVLMATLVGRVGGPRGSIAIYFVPLVAILLGATIAREVVAPLAIAGTALVIVGAARTSRGEPDMARPRRFRRTIHG